MIRGVQTADLLVHDAELIATVDDDRRELAGGWVAVTDGVVSGLGGPGDPQPDAVRRVDARGCLVTPGLVNTHHHLYQNPTRAYAPALTGGLFDWLVTLYPLWARLDEEAAHVSAFVGLAELALSGCTTSTDHSYVHPRGAGDLISAEVAAARELGVRFSPTRGSMSLCVKDGGLPPDSVVQDDDDILADSQRLVAAHHDPSPTATTRIALAPCSPFSVSTDLMRRTTELAESLDVRLHTHLAEPEDEDAFCLATFGRRPVDHLDDVGWMTDRTWLAHVVWPNAGEVARLGAARVGAAHCPSSNMSVGRRLRRPRRLVAGGGAVRRRAVGPGGGLAALRPGVRAAHGRGGAVRRRGRRRHPPRAGRAARRPPAGVPADAGAARLRALLRERAPGLPPEEAPGDSAGELAAGHRDAGVRRVAVQRLHRDVDQRVGGQVEIGGQR
jgi:cytosine/adenosine deaminase-related metal-dependent hydrolase